MSDPQDFRGYRRSLALAGRLAIGAVFLASGYIKLVAPPQEFAAAVEAYRLLPAGWELPFARVAPWIELFLGAFVLSGYWRRACAAALAGLLVSFIGAMGQALVRGIDLANCGCFGGLGPKLSPPQEILLDLVLLGLAVTVWAEPDGSWSLDRWIDGGPGSAIAQPSSRGR